MYRLTLNARADLREIYARGVDWFGLQQADDYADGLEKTFRFLADYPRAACKRGETDTSVRAHPYKSHLVLYLIEGDDILIVRVRHAHEDWPADPF